MRLATVHLITGITALTAFVLTGQYMHWGLAHLEGLPDTPRLLYRSAHIYLMFSGLCNLLAGVHCSDIGQRSARRIRTAGSALLLLSPPLFLVSFFSEMNLGVERPLLRLGIYASFAGVLLHAVSAWVARSPSRT